MKKVDVSTGSTKLRNALRTLRVRWEDTQNDWSDPVSRDFEENHLAPIEPRVLATLHAMTTLVQVLSKAQQDCE
jgi:hypothetical protein